MLKRTLAILATVFLTFISLSSASAHGEITQAVPAADSKVLSAPSEISIEFDGKLQTLGQESINSITVTDNQGQVISNPVSVVNGTKISNKLLLTDITGLVSVHYRIVSEDGHPVEGDYSFTIGETPTLYSVTDEEGAEAANGNSEESGSNLLVNGAIGVAIGSVAAFAVNRWRKK
jgi:hypothetical protein